MSSTPNELTPAAVARRADEVGRNLDHSGQEVLRRLKQHVWDLAVHVQRWHELVDEQGGFDGR